MFSLHERTQRRACRIAFVLACAVPTLLTLAWVLYFHRPWQERDWQRSIEHALHVRAEITHVSAPRPKERQLLDLRLADLQNSQPLADIEQLNIRGTELFSAERVSISSRQFEKLAETVNTWLAGNSFQSTMGLAEQLLLTGPTEEVCELQHLRAECRTTSAGVRSIIIQAEVGEDLQRVRLLVERSVDGTMRATLDVEESALPAWLLADIVPGASRWGSASLAGTLQLEKTASTFGGNFRGSVDPIDLQTWIGIASPHRLQSQGKLEIENLRWQNHRIQLAQGSLETAGGQMSNSLVQAFKEKFYCVVSESVVGDGDVFDFDKLSCRFRLNADGLTVTGTCPGADAETRGCLIQAGGKPWMMQPAYSSLPLAHFVQVLCPLEKHWLPATRAATDLAEKLPLPETEAKKR